MSLGLALGDAVAILGGNREEWLVADIAAILGGGIPVGIYTTNSPEQCRYIVDHSEASIVVVENGEQLAKILAVRDALPKVRAIVLMSGASDADGVVAWGSLASRAASIAEADLDARIAAQRTEDVCTLVYTSGTTGDPKVVMYSHDNLTWTPKALGGMVSFGPLDRIISYLPYSHIAEQCVFHAVLAVGGSIYFAESMDRLGDNLREVRPTIFFAVPRVWEKIQERMAATATTMSPLRKRISAWARRIGAAAGDADERGVARPLFYRLANRLVFSTVRERLGLDQSRVNISTAAPIARATLEFFRSVGVPVLEVYGMSECTGPAAVSIPGTSRIGSAGVTMPGTELKIAEDGEICMRGRHVFKGYFKNAQATADMIDADGWLKSGDVGTIDAQGFLRITDRKKDLLITAGGENIAPQLIEAQLKAVPVVSQAVVIGDRRKFLVALLTLDPEKVAATAAEAGSSARDVATAVRDSAYLAWIQRSIDDVNRSLARVQTIKKFTIIPSEFSIEGGELTPTMKVRRKVINQKYAAPIEAMYAE
jgi:long-subunit acyl-CoA synthetase (AMP-forming)